MDEYPAGSTVIVDAAFTNENDAAFDPDDVTLIYRKADGTEVPIALDDLTHPALGRFNYGILTAVGEHGGWSYRFEGVRLDPELHVVDEGEFEVTASTVLAADDDPAVTPEPDPLTADERAAIPLIRAHIGNSTPPTDIELAAALARLTTVELVALEILRTRLATMTSQAAQFTAVGDYSENWSENIKQLRNQIAGLESAAGVPSTLGATMTVGQLVRTDRVR